MTAHEIKQRYKIAKVARFPDHEKLLLICVNKTIEQVCIGQLQLLDAVRYSWKLNRYNAAQADYVLAVAHGLIMGVYVAEVWLEANKGHFPDIPDSHGNWGKQKGRYGFRGRKAPDDIWDRYVGKKIDDKWRGHGAPIRYTWNPSSSQH
jgi:hypothetical protein